MVVWLNNFLDEGKNEKLENLQRLFSQGDHINYVHMCCLC